MLRILYKIVKALMTPTVHKRISKATILSLWSTLKYSIEMEDHEYYKSKAYMYSKEISNEQENDISIKEKNGDAFLIELYRECPFLYNNRHNDFKNKIMKDNAWNEISKIMQNKNYGNVYTSEYCQTRCTSLRNQYNREKRILNSQYKSGSAASTHKPFVFYSQLSFLDNYVRKRSTHSKIKVNETSVSSISSSELSFNIPKSNSSEIFHINETSSDSIHEKEDNPNNQEENEENDLENIPQIIRKQTSGEERYFNILELDTKPVKHNKRENNEDKAFAQLIIAHLANLPQSEKNIRKKMITDALFSPLQKM